MSFSFSSVRTVIARGTCIGRGSFQTRPRRRVAGSETVAGSRRHARKTVAETSRRGRFGAYETRAAWNAGFAGESRRTRTSEQRAPLVRGPRADVSSNDIATARAPGKKGPAGAVRAARRAVRRGDAPVWRTGGRSVIYSEFNEIRTRRLFRPSLSQHAHAGARCGNNYNDIPRSPVTSASHGRSGETF